MTHRPPPPPPPSLARAPAYGTRVSRTYEPGDPELKKKKVRPFRLKELEHVPAEHKLLYRALLRSMPEALFEPKFERQVAELVQRYSGMDTNLWLHGVRVVETLRLRSLIPGVACILIVGLPPRAEKILVEVDLMFVYRVVGKLLGAKDSPVDIHRPLTEIEQGVFLFLALKVLALVQQGWAHPEQVALRIEDVRGDIKSTADVLRMEKRWLCVAYKMTFDLDVGAVRLFIPDSLAKTVVTERPPVGSALAERARQKVRERFQMVSGAVTEGYIEVGRIQLDRGDLGGLDPGDIVLLDEAKMQIQDGVVSGPAEMRIGLGRHGFLRGVVSVQNDQQVFEVHEIVIEEIPDAHDPALGHGDPENPEQVVAEYEDGAVPAEDESSEGEGELPEEHDQEAYDEEWGLDDEDDGDDEEYEAGGGEEYEEQAEEGQAEGYGEGGEEGEPAPPDDNLEQVEPLLGDIPMVLVVELGRVQLTADEVVRLRPGQLIELGRSPVDPVDLVVNGKLVAKGELVEIEGALGVKLLNLVRGNE